jgi:hypothetical protein
VSERAHRLKPYEVLIAHFRKNSSSCFCGWSDWGQSHAQHVIDMLYDEGYKIIDRLHEGHHEDEGVGSVTSEDKQTQFDFGPEISWKPQEKSGA